MDVSSRSTNLGARIDLAQEGDFQIGSALLRPSLRQVKLGDEEITIEPRVMQVFVALARQPGTVLSKWDLIQSCWDGLAVGDAAINRSVAAVRRFEDRAGISVTTIPRVGYRLTMALKPEQTAKSEPGRLDAALESKLRSWARAAVRRPLWAAGLGTVALLLAAWVAGIFPFRPATPELSVAVLRFDAQNQSADEQGFADSVSAGLADRIGMTPIKLVSTTESFQYKDAAKPEAYRKLDATYVVDGTVRADNGTMRVMLHFDNRATGETLFSKTFEAPQAERLALSRQVAAGIADRMRSVALIDPAKPDEAREMLGFWDAFRNGDFNTALALSKKLAQESPEWGKLQVQHALNMAVTIQFVPLPQRPARFAEAQRAIEKAAAIAPDEPLLNAARYFATPTADWAKRLALLRDGLAKNTGDPDLLHFLGLELMRSGYPDEALQYLNAAVTRDQNSFTIFIDAVTDMLLVQQWNMAHDLVDSHADLAVWPVQKAIISANRAKIAAETNQIETATALLNSQTLNMSGPTAKPRPFALVLTARSTRRPQDIAAALHACQDHGLIPPQYGSCVDFAAENGDPDTSFHMLQRLIPDMRGTTPQQRRQAWFRSIDFRLSEFAIPQLYDKHGSALRADPRFIRVADGLGLIDYWKRNGPPEFCSEEPGDPVCKLVAGRGQAVRS